MKRWISILLFLLVTLSSQFLFLRQVYAQTYIAPSNLMPQTEPGVPQDIHTATTGIFMSILSFISCQLSGIDPTAQNQQCLGYNSQSGKLGYIPSRGGALGILGSVITASFDIPIHTSHYIDYLASGFHNTIDPHSYAAPAFSNGVGEEGLHGILPIWVAVRNLSYLFIVIIFIVIGLGIMLRIKIDPRTVMSLQNQIPKIIFVLILITFSFAISGFLIDMMYVTTFLIINLIQGAVPGANPVDVTNLIQSPEPFSAINNIMPGGIIGAIGPTVDIIANILRTVGTSLNLGIIYYIINTPAYIIGIICWIQSISFPLFLALGAGNTCGSFFSEGIFGGILWIVFLVAIFTSLFRFWIALITCYITILIQIIIGPIRILGGALPGNPGGGFSGWFRDMVANLAVFPISLGFIYLMSQLARIFSSPNAFAPFLNNTGSAIASASPYMPMTPGGGLIATPAIIFVSINMLDQIVKNTLKMFKSENPFNIMGSLSSGGAVAGGTLMAAGKHLNSSGDMYRGIQQGAFHKFVYGNLANEVPKDGKVSLLQRGQQFMRRTVMRYDPNLMKSTPYMNPPKGDQGSPR